jgi:hypothetical protein
MLTALSSATHPGLRTSPVWGSHSCTFPSKAEAARSLPSREGERGRGRPARTAPCRRGPLSGGPCRRPPPRRACGRPGVTATAVTEAVTENPPPGSSRGQIGARRARSHSTIEPSRPAVASSLPSGLNAIPLMSRLWYGAEIGPYGGRSGRPTRAWVVTSNRTTVPSASAARVLPSGLNATASHRPAQWWPGPAWPGRHSRRNGRSSRTAG